MVTIHDIRANKLIEKLKEELKRNKDISPPDWVRFVKSGVHRERLPDQNDFWYVRSASLLRRIYINGPVGISRLRSYYGGRKKKGGKARHFRKSSGNMIRKILQQLEKSGLVEKDKKGRKISLKGRKFLNEIANEVSK